MRNSINRTEVHSLAIDAAEWLPTAIVLPMMKFPKQEEEIEFELFTLLSTQSSFNVRVQSRLLKQ
jgi:hypothetical protein